MGVLRAQLSSAHGWQRYALANLDRGRSEALVGGRVVELAGFQILPLIPVFLYAHARMQRLVAVSSSRPITPYAVARNGSL